VSPTVIAEVQEQEPVLLAGAAGGFSHVEVATVHRTRNGLIQLRR
jgi:hypothetical protein